MNNKKAWNRKTNEEVDKILSQHGFTRLGEYVGNSEPVKCEKNGYWYNVRLSNIIKGQNVSTFGSTNPFLAHNIQVELDKKGEGATYISHKRVRHKKNKCTTIVTMRCACGNIFTRDIWQIKTTSKTHTVCNECANKIKNKKNANSMQKMRSAFYKKGYKIIEEPATYGQNELWLLEDNEGYRGYLEYAKIRGGRDLAIYAPNNFELRPYNLNVFFKINKVDSEALYMVDREHIKVKCACGETFTALYYQIFSKCRFFCPNCNHRISKWSRMISDFLEENNIEYKKEFIINSCKDKLPLPFDFWLKKYNILIEVDGEQHFQSIEHFGGDERFEYVKKHDAIKTNYCQEWNIPLLRISYVEIQNGEYKDKIKKFIQSIQD